MINTGLKKAILYDKQIAIKVMYYTRLGFELICSQVSEACSEIPMLVPRDGLKPLK